MTPQAEIPEPQPIRVSVVIVSFNRRDSLRKSLEMLGETHQVVVVDNGSTDGSAALAADFPHVRWNRLPKNFGLTKALNIGIRASDGEFILLLHDDARISAEAVTRLSEVLETRPEVGAVCPLLTGEDGKPGPQIRALPSPANPYPAFQPASAGGDEVTAACVSSAAIMFRMFFLRAMRHIDERYGQYGSDIDLCAQVGRAAKKILILRSVTAIHEDSDSPMSQAALEGDRAAGTAAFLGKYHGMASSLGYRVKAGLAGLLTFRFLVAAGALSGQKIDGTG